MAIPKRKFPSIHHFLFAAVLLFLLHLTAVAAIGINYGTLGNNLPPPAQVANFVKTKTIFDRVKIFDTNPDILRAFANTGISITVTAANSDVPALGQLAFARQWVAINIAPFYPQTKIIRVLVGNEIFFWGDKNLMVALVPAMKTLHNALVLAGFKGIQVTTPHALGIIQNSEPPSSARFGKDYNLILRPLLQFLRETKSPFAVNPYSYFGYTPSKANYALFKPNRGVYDQVTGHTYTNMFDALLDSVYTAMKAEGYADVPILVGETGWPSLGDPGQPAPTLANAVSYNGNLVKHLRSKRGTPLMPNRRFETYIFALFNENSKPGPLAERNFGLFQPDFSPVYDIGIMRNEARPVVAPGTGAPKGGHHRQPGGRAGRSPAPGKLWCVPRPGATDQALQSNVDYVCSMGIDCRPIQAGGPCFEPNNVKAHASFAMNSYYQTNGRHIYNCDFANTGLLTQNDPSYGNCRYM